MYDYALTSRYTNTFIDTEFSVYPCSHVSILIHEAFYYGLIMGENIPKPKRNINGEDSFDFDILFLPLITIINSLNEFKNTINVAD